MRARSNKIRLTGIIRQILFALNVIAIALMFCAFLAWRISPLKTNLFSYIGLAFGLILLANILFLGLWILFDKWKLAFISILSLVLCYKPITTFFPLHLFSNKAPDDSISLLTYNVQGFINERSKKAKDNPLLNYIANTDADIVCLQEYMVSKTGQSIKSQRDINKILDKYPYRSVTPLRSSSNSLTYGLACFSKYPIESSEEILFNSSYNGAVIYTINIEGNKYTVANVHLESNNINAEDKKLYSDFLQNADGTNLESVTTNIRNRLGKAYRIRSKQVELVKEKLNSIEADGTIICGDFNDTPISYTYAQMAKGMKDAFVSSGFGAGISYNEHLFWFRIDNIMHSPNLKSYKAKIDRVPYSDHYPMRAAISLNN